MTLKQLQRDIGRKLDIRDTVTNGWRGGQYFTWSEPFHAFIDRGTLTVRPGDSLTELARRENRAGKHKVGFVVVFDIG